MNKKQKELRQKYMVETIRPGKSDRLSINWDTDSCSDNPSPKQRYAMMLFTPDMDNTLEHWHIKLTDKQAEKLRDWLDQFLEMKGR